MRKNFISASYCSFSKSTHIGGVALMALATKYDGQSNEPFYGFTAALLLLMRANVYVCRRWMCTATYACFFPLSPPSSPPSLPLHLYPRLRLLLLRPLQRDSKVKQALRVVDCFNAAYSYGFVSTAAFFCKCW